ncbi:MAG: N-acetyltransferase [Lutibacter sp.]|nr:MAG: N-acetyltransferase [Lutibacter sp.]
MPIVLDKENKQFTLDINGELAKVEYILKKDKMLLVHSEVPYNLRGKGIGKVLVKKTFEQLTSENFKAIAISSYIKIVAKRSKKWNKIIEY